MYLLNDGEGGWLNFLSRHLISYMSNLMVVVNMKVIDKHLNYRNFKMTVKIISENLFINQYNESSSRNCILN